MTSADILKQGLHLDIDVLIPIINTPSHPLYKKAIDKYRHLVGQTYTVQTKIENNFSELPKKIMPPVVIIESKSKDDYFQIDRKKEKEYRDKIKKYVARDSRPHPDYLQP